MIASTNDNDPLMAVTRLKDGWSSTESKPALANDTLAGNTIADAILMVGGVLKFAMSDE